MTREHRLVPLEGLREFTRSRVELSSIRDVAEEVNVGRSTIHKFLKGSTPHPRVRRLLGLWYLRQEDGIGETELMRPYLRVFDTLLSEVPESAYVGITAGVLASVERGCLDHGAEVPRWVMVMRDRLPWAGLNAAAVLPRAPSPRPVPERNDNEGGTITLAIGETS